MDNGRTFKYVDKDRLYPWIDKRIEFLSEIRGTEQHGRIEQLKELKEKVESGLFDWQPAE